MRTHIRAIAFFIVTVSAIAGSNHAAFAQAGANEAGVHINDQLHQVRSGDSDATTRRSAVLNLLNDVGPNRVQAMQSLVTELRDNKDAAVRRAILQGIRLTDPNLMLDDAFGPIIVSMLSAWDDTWIEDAAGALGRITSPSLTQKLAAIASDNKATSSARVTAVNGLGFDRSQQAAQTLVSLLDSSGSTISAAALESAAYRSLTRLTGLDEYANDAEVWRRWWDRSRSLNADQWQKHLIENHVRRADRLARSKSQAQDRLLLALRQRYRATPEADRQDVLIDMVVDKIPEIRGLGLELVRELLIGGEIRPPLTAALIGRLDDESPNVRSAAAYVLRDLKNDDAADIAAQRLALKRETDRSVMRAYLLLIERSPRAVAMDAVLELLEDPKVRGEAAGALIAAIDKQTSILDERRMEQAAARIRKQLNQDGDPEPRFVELLGRVGKSSDWRYIERWLDSENAAVREAAAKVWAKYDQPLDALATRAGDELIRAVLIPAAQLRGHTAETLSGLIKNRPQQTQLVDAWSQAIVSVTGRVTADIPNRDGTLSPLELVQADAMMTNSGINNDLRLQALSAGVEKLTRIAAQRASDPLTQLVDGKPQMSPRFAPHLIDLLISRARVHLADADAKASLADLERIKQVAIEPSGGQAARIVMIAVESQLRTGKIDDAFTLADPHLMFTEGTLPSSLRSPMIDLMLSAADMSIASKQHASAGVILTRLRSRLGSTIGIDLETRISVLEGKIKMAVDRAG